MFRILGWILRCLVASHEGFCEKETWFGSGCCRYKGHPGKHRTYEGEEWPL